MNLSICTLQKDDGRWEKEEEQPQEGAVACRPIV